jgi:hypothetical protein
MKRVLIGVLVALLVLTVTTIALRRNDRPRGLASPRQVIDSYLTALQTRSADDIEDLVSEDFDGGQEARDHVKKWGGTDPGAVTVTELPSEKHPRFRLTSEGDHPMDQELTVDNAHGRGWFLQLGEGHPPSKDGPPALQPRIYRCC